LAKRGPPRDHAALGEYLRRSSAFPATVGLPPRAASAEFGCMRTFLLAAFMALTPLGHAASYTAEQVAAESAKANALFERSFQDSVDRNPLLQAQLGIKKDSDKWQDLSDARAVEDLARSLGYLAELKRTVRPDALDPQTQLSYRLFVDTIERRVRAFPFRLYNYPVNQNGGIHTSVATTLANLHRIDNRNY
jgi:uncharacterized protein (DUF885 family)